MDPRDIYFKTISKKMSENYTVRGFEFSSFQTKEECKKFLLDSIDKNAKIGFGGSATIAAMDLINYFRENDYPNLLDRDTTDAALKEQLQIQTFGADVFLSSTNAMTVDGQLVNIDKIGNRVAAMIYGPKKVYVVTSINKVVLNREEALSRASQRAAVINNIRFNVENNPCVKLGRCISCKEATKLCLSTSIIAGSFPQGRIHVLLINEDLGF